VFIAANESWNSDGYKLKGMVRIRPESGKGVPETREVLSSKRRRNKRQRYHPYQRKKSWCCPIAPRPTGEGSPPVLALFEKERRGLYGGSLNCIRKDLDALHQTEFEIELLYPKARQKRKKRSKRKIVGKGQDFRRRPDSCKSRKKR